MPGGESERRLNMTTNQTTRTSTLRLAPIDAEEYDALADLFLGDSPLAPERAPVRDRAGPGSLPEVAVVVDDEFFDDETLIDLPSPPERASMIESKPIVIEPEPDSVPAVQPDLVELIESEESAVPTDEMPVQVLGRIEPELAWDDETVEDLYTAKRPMIEVVLLGHLPVRATLWVRQYACSVARETGETVALIRAASGSTAVDLIDGKHAPKTKPAVSIQHALEKAAHLADRVILRVDESAEPDLLERPEIDQLTILTGADETAVVASYRLIKTLTASWDWDDANAPTLRMAVMGGSRAQSTDARAKLTRAVESFLDRQIEIVISAGRIDATGTMNLYRDDLAHPATHILDGLIEGAMADLDDEPVDWAEEDTAEPQAMLESADRSPIDLLREDIDALETLESLTRRVRAESPAVPAEVESEEPMSETTPRRHDTLSGLIPGLSVIESRCPSAPGVELATDIRGRVHMVVDDGGADPLGRLFNAKAWVRDHLQLLMRAEPSIAMPSSDPLADAEPTMHLLAEHPREYMSVYPTTVRVYAMATVRVGHTVARVATPIN